MDFLQKENYKHQQEDANKHDEDEEDEENGNLNEQVKQDPADILLNDLMEKDADLESGRKLVLKKVESTTSNKGGQIAKLNSQGNVRDSVINIRPSMSEIEQGGNKKVAQNDSQGGKKLREVTMVELMQYYSPKSLVVLSFVVTFIAGFGYPAHGFLFFELLFKLMDTHDSNYWFYTNLFCGMFLVTGLGIGLTQFL
jgi:hypothetical protein